MWRKGTSGSSQLLRLNYVYVIHAAKTTEVIKEIFTEFSEIFWLGTRCAEENWQEKYHIILQVCKN